MAIEPFELPPRDPEDELWSYISCATVSFCVGVLVCYAILKG